MTNSLHHHEKIAQEYGELSALIDLVELPPKAVPAITPYGEVAYSVHSGRNNDFGVIIITPRIKLSKGSARRKVLDYQ